MRKKVKIVTEEEKRYCDICGERLVRQPVEISALVIDRIILQDMMNSGGYADIESKGFIKFSEKDICWHCIEKSIKQCS